MINGDLPQCNSKMFSTFQIANKVVKVNPPTISLPTKLLYITHYFHGLSRWVHALLEVELLETENYIHSNTTGGVSTAT